MEENYPMTLTLQHLRDNSHIEGLKEVVEKDAGANLHEEVTDPKEFLITKCDYIESELAFGNIEGAIKHSRAASEYLKQII